MTRLQKILSAILIVQLALAVVVFWPRQPATAAGGPLFPDLTPEEVTAVRIIDDAGDDIELARQDDGWVLPDADDFPASAAQIESVLEKITAVQTNRLVAQTETSHARLQVADDEFLRRVTLETAAGPTYTLYVGSAPNPSATHVRRAGADETFLASGLASWELNAQPSAWIDATYVTLDREQVQSLVLENGNGAFTFEKNAAGEWTMAGLSEDEIFDVNQFNPILNQIVNLQMVAPLGLEAAPEYGLDTPQATVSVTIAGEEGAQTHTLLVGTQVDGENYAVKWSEADYYVSVAPFALSNMIERTREDFLTAPATPTPEAPAEGQG